MKNKYCNCLALIKKEIQNLVADDQLENAVLFLWEITEMTTPQAMTEVIVLKRNISEVNRQYRTGQISFQDYSEMRNKLANRLLNILEEVLKAENQSSRYG